MARIRSIHPNTPTDPELAAIPISGRLLFVYSWTIADDAGNLEGNPVGLKMALFPADTAMTVKKVAGLVEALIVGRFYIPYESDGKKYLHVRNFAKYQKLDHPTAPKVPLAPGQEYVYHVRQGNTFVPRTENGPTSIPRTTHEQHTNSTRTLVCRSRRTGLDRTGLERKGKELDRKGTDRRGPGRKGKPCAVAPSPLDGGGGAAFLSTPPRKDDGNGKATASGKVNPITDATGSIISAVKGVKGIDWRLSLPSLRDRIAAGELTTQQARKGLLALGAKESELDEVLPLEVTP